MTVAKRAVQLQRGIDDLVHHVGKEHLGNTVFLTQIHAFFSFVGDVQEHEASFVNLCCAVGQHPANALAVGQALTEGTRYGDDARQRNTGLLEYKLQTAADAPTVRTVFVEIPDPNAGPHGAKGLAEAPNVPTAAAIANAVSRLIGTPVRQLPMTAERVWTTSAGGAS